MILQIVTQRKLKAEELDRFSPIDGEEYFNFSCNDHSIVKLEKMEDGFIYPHSEQFFIKSKTESEAIKEIESIINTNLGCIPDKQNSFEVMISHRGIQEALHPTGISFFVVCSFLIIRR